MRTPKEIKEAGYLIFDTNEAIDTTGIMLPLNMGNEPIRGTLQMIVDDAGEDLDIAKDLVYTSPELTPASPYRVKPSVYVSSEDRLVTFDRCIGMDGVLAIIGLFDDEDVKLEWG